MSKYDALWRYVAECKDETLLMSFGQIEEVGGVPIDHSFLKYKKELSELGWQVEKIGMKAQNVLFRRIESKS